MPSRRRSLKSSNIMLLQNSTMNSASTMNTASAIKTKTPSLERSISKRRELIRKLSQKKLSGNYKGVNKDRAISPLSFNDANKELRTLPIRHNSRSPQHRHNSRSPQRRHNSRSPQRRHNSRSPQRRHGSRSPHRNRNVENIPRMITLSKKQSSNSSIERQTRMRSKSPRRTMRPSRSSNDLSQLCKNNDALTPMPESSSASTGAKNNEKSTFEAFLSSKTNEETSIVDVSDDNDDSGLRDIASELMNLVQASSLNE